MDHPRWWVPKSDEHSHVHPTFSSRPWFRGNEETCYQEPANECLIPLLDSTTQRDDGVDHTFAGEPQEEGMMRRSSSFHLILKPRLSDPVGLGEGLARCQRRRLRQLTWTCTQSQTKLLCPNETERLSISPACWTQRIKCPSVKYDDSKIWPASKWVRKAIKMVVNSIAK